MSAQLYRLLLAGGNFLLVVFIGLLALSTIRGGEVPPAEKVPKGFDPVQLAVESAAIDGGDRSKYRVISQEFDRAEPVVERRPPDRGPDRTPTPPPPPTSGQYSLVMVSYDPEHDERSSVILKDRSQQQFTVATGDDFDGFKVEKIEIRGQAEERVAVVTLSRGEEVHTIELRRQP